MARMHSRKKGASRSRPPSRDSPPEWCDMTPEEVEKIVLRMFDGGMSTSKIGLTLRDQYGVPSSKLLLGRNMTRFLKERTTVPEIPEDLANLMRKALVIRRHLRSNQNDVHNKRSLQLCEGKIRRLVRYYIKSGKLAKGWEYKPETAEMLVT
ncbi:MAG: 30S ribosomal protein S15 [Methanotrichaceae archaeon]|nr:30S ribosomal protein S15 [Methanotrichaceae archaeon]